MDKILEDEAQWGEICTRILGKKHTRQQLFIDGMPIPQIESAKYLDLPLYSRLNWKHHLQQKSQAGTVLV